MQLTAGRDAVFTLQSPTLEGEGVCCGVDHGASICVSVCSQTLVAVGDKHMSVSCTQERASSCCMQSSLLHASQSDHNSVGLLLRNLVCVHTHT
jgi:hypothetical protein